MQIWTNANDRVLCTFTKIILNMKMILNIDYKYRYDNKKHFLK